MASDGIAANKVIDLELEAGAHEDFYVLAHSVICDPALEISGHGTDFTVTVLRNGSAVAAPISATGSFARVEVSGTHPPTAPPNPGPSLGFRITNTDAVRGSFSGAIAWTYGAR